VHMSTNKVYGDRPNTIKLKELGRWWIKVWFFRLRPASLTRKSAEDAEIKSLRNRMFEFHTSIQQRQIF